MHDTDRRAFLETAAAATLLPAAGCVDTLGGGDTENDVESIEIETVADGLAHPWGLAFLPDEPRLLVTEREGRLSLVDREDGSRGTIEGTPEVFAEGHGGLLDVTLHPEFGEEPWVYLTYAATNDDGGLATTQLGRGRLDRDGGRLEAFEELYVAEPFAESENHFGSRAVFGEDDMLYMTTPDRESKEFGPDHVSQDTSNGLGATLRLEPDGSVPEDNPFVDSDAEDAIYSYGHRNAQGMTVHPETGELWQSEHGESDGDEINVIEAGGNYGWPVASYACHYASEDPLGDEPHEREDTVDPVHYWECTTGGFPPGGMTFYDGEAFPGWEGDLFVGNLGDQYLGRFAVDGTDLEEVDQLLADEGWRVREVEVAPDTGHLYVLVDDREAPVVRLVPE